ncbi:hypothetical protein KDL01_39885 [Actinospica durhamensis]|uniref:Uncharacterized protein n=1 Tax=Actinospica durhamensis TaxID=1508375 RepID=A0A941EX65_9ACTN|nr:hypothetical protein [Actinospica durhamensis]MBR7839485.1 hypothetical protein [Actinospica durhamensis]
MTKFRVNVCLKPCATHEVNAALAAAMAPFDMNLSDDFNPHGEWDWWRIEAEPGHRFTVKPEHNGDPRLIYADDDREPLRCDGGPRGLLDFDATRRQAVDQARAEWQAEQLDFRRLLADHPPAQPLTAFLARHNADPEGYPREQAVADHHTQPLVRALNHRSAWDRYPNLGVWALGPDSDPITRYTRGPQPEIDEAAAWAVTRYALLTLEGEWIDPTRLGSFAEPHPGEAAPAAYARQSSTYLDGLHEDCVIVTLL